MVGFPTLLGEVSTVTVPSTTAALIESALHHSAEPSPATSVEVFITPRPDGEAA